MKTLEAISNFISKYMAAFVIIVAAIALFMPWTFTWSAICYIFIGHYHVWYGV